MKQSRLFCWRLDDCVTYQSIVFLDREWIEEEF